MHYIKKNKNVKNRQIMEDIRAWDRKTIF